VIISRYLTREVTNALLAVTLVLLLAFLSQQIVRYLTYAASGKIATEILLQLISFEIPYLLALLLPLGLYLGILLAYGRLYADNEMSILQMCGFGSARLMSLTVIIAAIVSIAVLFLMIWVNPWISAKRQQVMATHEAAFHLIKTLIPGRFQTTPDGRYVMYVETLSRDHEQAKNVFLAQERKDSADPSQNSWNLVRATTGYQTQDKESQQDFFVTTDGYRYEGAPGRNDFKIIQFKKYAVRMQDSEIKVTHLEEEALPTLALWQGHSAPKYAAELQWRLSIAISTFLLAMLAVPLSVVRPRHGRYLALFPAVLVYVVYMNLLFLARHWLEMGAVPMSLGMWWVHAALLIIIALIVLIRSKQWAG
jgi:lipopolysaccharide export system permease protein